MELVYLYSMYLLANSTDEEDGDDTLIVFLESAIRLWFFKKMSNDFLMNILQFSRKIRLYNLFFSFFTGAMPQTTKKEWNQNQIGILFRDIYLGKTWKEIGLEIGRPSECARIYFNRLYSKIVSFCQETNISSFGFINEIVINSIPYNYETSNTVKDPCFILSKMRNFRSKIGNLSKAVKRLENQLKVEHNKAVELEVQLHMNNAEAMKQTFGPLASKIINTSIQNKDKKTHAQYDDQCRLFWIDKYSRGLDVFSQLTDILHGPAFSTVQQWIKKLDCPKSSDLKDISKSEMVIKFWFQHFHPSTKNCILVVDAIKLDEDLTIRNNTVKGIINESTPQHHLIQYASNPEVFQQIIDYYREKKQIISNVYIFYVVCLDNTKCFPIHYKFSDKGVGNKDIMFIAKDLVDKIGKLGMRVRYIGSDSDPAYNEKKLNFLMHLSINYSHLKIKI